MTFKRALTPEKEAELLEDYLDGCWSINDISVIYRISIRTVYRILADHDVRLKNKRTRRKRRPREQKPIVLKPCGTNAAYQRHRKKGEYPCTPCLEAHAANVKEYK